MADEERLPAPTKHHLTAKLVSDVPLVLQNYFFLSVSIWDRKALPADSDGCRANKPYGGVRAWSWGAQEDLKSRWVGAQDIQGPSR